jgi:hypothetical protein
MKNIRFGPTILVDIKSVKAKLYTKVRQAITMKNAKMLFIIEKFIIYSN